MKIELTERNLKLFKELAEGSGVNVNNAYFNVFIENSLVRELERVKE